MESTIPTIQRALVGLNAVLNAYEDYSIHYHGTPEIYYSARQAIKVAERNLECYLYLISPDARTFEIGPTRHLETVIVSKSTTFTIPTLNK